MASFMTFGSIANRKGKSGKLPPQSVVGFRYNFEDFDYSTQILKNTYNASTPVYDASVSNTTRAIWGILENKYMKTMDEGSTFYFDSTFTNVISVSMSMTGKYVALLLSGTGGVRLSSDYGTTFTTILATTSGIGIKMSDDGKYMVYVGDSSIKVSSNYGSTWTTKVTGLTINNTNNHWPIAMSSDGKYIYVAYTTTTGTTNGRKSSDYGATWASCYNKNGGYICNHSGNYVSGYYGSYSTDFFVSYNSFTTTSNSNGNGYTTGSNSFFTTGLTNNNLSDVRTNMQYNTYTNAAVGSTDRILIYWNLGESTTSGLGTRGLWKPRDESFTFHIGEIQYSSTDTKIRRISKLINYDTSAVMLQNNISFTTVSATCDFNGSNYRIVDKYQPILGTRSLCLRNVTGDVSGLFVTLPSLTVGIAGFSLSFWIKVPTTATGSNVSNPDGAKLFWFDDTIGNQFGLSLYSNKLAAHVQNASVMTQITDGSIYNVALNDGNARHISWVISYNGGGTPIWYFYVNGALTNTITTNTAYPTATTYTSNFIGCSTAKNDYCEANFDDVRYELTEITQSIVTTYYGVLTPVYLGTNMDLSLPVVGTGLTRTLTKGATTNNWTISTTTGNNANVSFILCDKGSTTNCTNASQCPKQQYLAVKNTLATSATATYTDIYQNIMFPYIGEYFLSFFVSINASAYNISSMINILIDDIILKCEYPLPVDYNNYPSISSSTSWKQIVYRFYLNTANSHKISFRFSNNLTYSNLHGVPYQLISTVGTNATSTTCLANIQVYYYN